MDENAIRNITFVAVSGAAGGTLGFIFSQYIGHEPRFGIYLDAALWTAMGAGAALIFIFLMANTDRTDNARLISLALVAGFFWQPVLEGSKALIERNSEVRTEAQTVSRLESARSAIDSLGEISDSASNEDKAALMSEIRSNLLEAESLAKSLDRISSVEDVARASERIFGDDEANEIIASLGIQPSSMLVFGGPQNRHSLPSQFFDRGHWVAIEEKRANPFAIDLGDATEVSEDDVAEAQDASESDDDRRL